ncbi:CPBP family intramembrane glutamic endopeptidase [Actinomadura syzygii]|uniref:CPBP family intramembrane metalloprotease n=1 Tax=Actinomadura syzygii TaxID=1427538 RepID=A0A5D0TT14_9ACTN|nr:CPBP family intramembrane glutamic endopeptidase [Actinomadura syzygii]TYC08580.1 CPBP family intramembrane metalloprotease [Actinomadura syzygii]
MPLIPLLLRLGWCVLGAVATLAGYLAMAVPITAAVHDPMVATLVVDGVVVLAVVGVRLVRPRWVAYGPGPRPMPQTPRFWAWVALAGAFVFLAGQTAALMLYGLLGSPQFDANVEHQRSSPAGLVVLVTLVLAPISEEVLFRGLLYPLLRRQAGVLMSAVVTALAFALVHGNLVQAAPAVLLALLLALVYERTRVLWPVVALHTVFNLAASIVAPSALQALATPLCSGLFLAVCALCLVGLYQRATVQSTSGSAENAPARQYDQAAVLVPESRPDQP